MIPLLVDSADWTNRFEEFESQPSIGQYISSVFVDHKRLHFGGLGEAAISSRCCGLLCTEQS